MLSSSAIKRGIKRIISKESSQPSSSGLPHVLTLELPDHYGDLLRGTSRATLLRKGSILFKGGPLANKEQECLFELSETVDELSEFLSHSWHSSRWQKFICLTIHYNAQPAMICSFLSSFVAMLFFVAGWLPPQASGVHTKTRREYEWGVWCVLVFGPSVFLIVLFTWQNICDFVGIPTKHVFFDRVCINQADEEKKQAGILSLGAFIARSRSVVILWSPEYLTRLWCVFEVAVLNHLTENSSTPLHLEFIPLPTAFAFVGGWVTAQCISMLAEALLLLGDPKFRTVGDGQLPTLGLLIVCSIVMLALGTFTRRLFRSYLLARQQVSTQLDTFSLEQAKCYLEKDRLSVNRSIGVMFGDGNKEVGKHKFETAVRGSFKDRINAALSYHLPYRNLLFMSWPVVWLEMDFVFAYMRSNFPVEVIIYECLMGIGFVFLFLPACNLAMLEVAIWMPSRGVLFVDVCVSSIWYIFIAINWMMGAFATDKWYFTFPVILWWASFLWLCNRIAARLVRIPEQRSRTNVHEIDKE